jgi:hypothetical protein
MIPKVTKILIISLAVRPQETTSANLKLHLQLIKTIQEICFNQTTIRHQGCP